MSTQYLNLRAKFMQADLTKKEYTLQVFWRSLIGNFVGIINILNMNKRRKCIVLIRSGATFLYHQKYACLCIPVMYLSCTIRCYFLVPSEKFQKLVKWYRRHIALIIFIFFCFSFKMNLYTFIIFSFPFK